MFSGSFTFQFPKLREIGILLIVISFSFTLHIGERAPLLYSTENQQVMEEGVYGMRLGPNREMIHFDAVNYWSMENLFSGNFRGTHIGTINRPAFGFFLSLFDRYIHKVYVGWIVNLFFWVLSSLFVFQALYHLSQRYSESVLGMILYSCAPMFTNVAGQPLGYVMGYALFVLFICIAIRIDYYQKHPWKYNFATWFLLCAGDLTYEIVGPICGIFLLLFGWGKIKASHIGFIGAGSLLVKGIWHFLITSPLFSMATAATSVTGSGQAQEALPFLTGSVLVSVLAALAFGIALSTFFIPSFLMLLLGHFMTTIQRRIFFAGLVAVSLPLFYMGVIGESVGDLRFYKHGRVIAYYAPFILLFLPSALNMLLQKWAVPQSLRIPIGIGMVLFLFTLSNLDVVGIRWLYYIFNYREGFRFV